MRRQGTSVVGTDELETLIDGKDCAYVIYGKRRFVVLNKLIIKAQLIGNVPVIYILFALKTSLNLLLSIMTSGIFDPACSLGQELEVPVYKFVKEALVRRFGEDWWSLKNWPRA
jgi:hypothetical protein